jgi:hypothetical protein
MSVHPIIDGQWNRLNSLAGRGNLSTMDWLRMMLNIGMDALGMDMGIISHIVGQDYTIQFCTHPRYSVRIPVTVANNTPSAKCIVT